MSRIEEIRGKLSDTPMITPVSDADLEAIKSKFVDVPTQYIEFLKEIGDGEIGNIQVYGGLIPPSDIYPCPEGDLSNIVLFGDDFQGYCFGFDISKQFVLVEVDPRGNARTRSEKDFLALIESYLSE